jgi:hypothetical protein
MSRAGDEKELRKLEYLERCNVATFDDRLRKKELARKMAIEDFEESEEGREAIKKANAARMKARWGANPPVPGLPFTEEKKGDVN